MVRVRFRQKNPKETNFVGNRKWTVVFCGKVPHFTSSISSLCSAIIMSRYFLLCSRQTRVLINMVPRTLCNLNVNIYHFGSFAEMADASSSHWSSKMAARKRSPDVQFPSNFLQLLQIGSRCDPSTSHYAFPCVLCLVHLFIICPKHFDWLSHAFSDYQWTIYWSNFCLLWTVYEQELWGIPYLSKLGDEEETVDLSEHWIADGVGVRFLQFYTSWIKPLCFGTYSPDRLHGWMTTILTSLWLPPHPCCYLILIFGALISLPWNQVLCADVVKHHPKERVLMTKYAHHQRDVIFKVIVHQPQNA